MGEVRNASTILVRIPEGKIPRGRPRRRWKDNIRIVFREVRWKCVDWVHLTLDRYQWKGLLNMVMYLGHFLTEGLLASQYGLPSMELVQFLNALSYIASNGGGG
jgi:hypothetical protein